MSFMKFVSLLHVLTCRFVNFYIVVVSGLILYSFTGQVSFKKSFHEPVTVASYLGQALKLVFLQSYFMLSFNVLGK